MGRKIPFIFLALSSLLFVACTQTGSESSVSLPLGSSSDSSASSITSSATSEPEKPWTVTFDFNHAEAPTLSPIDVEDGAKITPPVSSFSPEGDTFLGWFKDSESLVPWIFSSDVVTANRTLFGGWQSILEGHSSSSENPSDSGDSYDYYDSDFYPIVFDVTFDGNYPSAPITIKKVPDQSTVRAPSFVREGYALEAWSETPNGTSFFDFETLITGPLTLYAQWSILTSYVVTLDLNYTGAPAATTVPAYGGLRLARPTSPTRDNYDFLGWYKDSTGTNAWNFSSDFITGNITLYARWQRLALPGVYVRVSELWAQNDATFVLWCGSQTVNATSVPTGVPNEYYFDHAATSYLALMVGQVYGIAPSGGWGTQWNQITLRSDTANNNAQLDASSGLYVDLGLRDNSIDENLVLRTVTFDLSYEGSATPTTKTILDGFSVSAPANPTRTGYNFLGWSTAPSGTLFDFSSLITADLTLFAQWQEKPEPIQVSVTFDSNYEGAGSPISVNATVGELLASPSGILRSGYTIVGWYREATLTTLWNFTSDTVAGAMTLYAKWTTASTTRTDGVYILMNDAWVADSATFELYYSVVPSGGIQTVTGTATDVAKEYFFNQILGSGPVILRRKVSGTQVAQIYNIATWTSSGHDYRDFGTGWNRIVLASSLAGNVSNQAASSSILTLDLRPSNGVSGRIRSYKPMYRKEVITYA